MSSRSNSAANSAASGTGADDDDNDEAEDHADHRSSLNHKQNNRRHSSQEQQEKEERERHRRSRRRQRQQELQQQQKAKAEEKELPIPEYVQFSDNEQDNLRCSDISCDAALKVRIEKDVSTTDKDDHLGGSCRKKNRITKRMSDIDENRSKKYDNVHSDVQRTTTTSPTSSPGEHKNTNNDENDDNINKNNSNDDYNDERKLHANSEFTKNNSACESYQLWQPDGPLGYSMTSESYPRCNDEDGNNNPTSRSGAKEDVVDGEGVVKRRQEQVEQSFIDSCEDWTPSEFAFSSVGSANEE